MAALLQDLRYAARSLRRSPGFAITAVALAAIGTGASTAALAVADHVLLRPLPYFEPDRLVQFWQADRETPESGATSPGNYRDLVAAASAFERVAAYTPRAANLTGRGAPVRLEGQLATGELFEVLGTQAALGRAFTPADAANERESVVVLSHAAWRTHFGGDPDIIGRAISLEGFPHVVIGVMPRGFLFPDRATEFWSTLAFDAAAYEDRSNTYLRAVARLAPGHTLEEADAVLDATAAELERAFPRENEGLTIRTIALRGTLTGASRAIVAGVLGAALCLLLIAATNLAGLLLARGLSRRQELAVRAAIGAGRGRLVRQMLTESALLAAAGGALGAWLAVTGAPLLARLVPTALPLAESPAVDARFLALAAAVTFATALAVGVLPARRAAGGIAPGSLGESSRTGASRRTEGLRAALVVAQVAASVVLLVSLGLLTQALWRVQALDPGFETGNVLTLRTSLTWPGYGPTARRNAFYDRVLGDVRALPGVEAAGFVTGLPMAVGGLIWRVEPEAGGGGKPEQVDVGLRFATPGYFDAMSIPIKEGRDFLPTDTRESPFVAVISESLARRLWPGRSALGRRINIAFFDRTVVGVVGDVRVRGLERTSEPQLYLGSQQVPDYGLINSPPKDLVIRASNDPRSLVPAIRAIVARADPEMPITNVRMLEDVVADQTAPRATQARVLAVFAVIAMLLAAVGQYGLLAFNVSQRVREIGVRMALGATPPSLAGLVLGRGLALAAAGAGIGIVAAYGGARWMQSLLAGVSPADARVYAVAVGAAVVFAAAGALLPALRAARVDPLAALRAE